MPSMQNSMSQKPCLDLQPACGQQCTRLHFYRCRESTYNTSTTLAPPMKTKHNDRRDFLKASAAATLFPGPFVHAQSKDKKYRTAIIGCGWWGMNILREAM